MMLDSVESMYLRLIRDMRDSMQKVHSLLDAPVCPTLEDVREVRTNYIIAMNAATFLLNRKETEAEEEVTNDNV
jgi:hypothetical protein